MNRALFLVACLVACKSSDKAPDKAPEPTKVAAPAPAPKPPLPAIDATKFDRTCEVATDCVVVKPASCDPCACPNEAIASKANGAFDEAVGKLACPVDLDAKCEPCAVKVAACTSKQCVVAP